uniref:Uncharacterized protein n=1 Tax=Anguilla anguilla TaxID=7936 RepID=A0A0E9UNC6_ANGAN
MKIKMERCPLAYLIQYGVSVCPWIRGMRKSTPFTNARSFHKRPTNDGSHNLCFPHQI